MATTNLSEGSLSDAFLVNEDKIVEALERIIAKADPMRVTVFGSRARGTHRIDSDLDLAVMVAHLDSRRDQWPVSSADLGGAMPVDLLVFGRERHEFMKQSIISVHYDIDREGVVVYDRSAGSIDLGAVERVSR